MRRLGLALVCVFVLAPSTATAERDPIVSFMAGMSAIGPLDPPDDVGGPEDIGLQLRGTVAWEQPPLPYKEPRGYAFAGTIVPEIFFGTIMAAEDRTEMVGGGLRLEARFSQRKMGLLQVSARGGFYLAGRGGFFTDPERSPFLEGAFGEYVLLGDTARIGVELGFMGIYPPQDDRGGVVIRGGLAGPPFGYEKGQYLNINAAFYLGVNM
jgi:hypothetical protein